MTSPSPMDRAVQDFKNSSGLQMSLASYYVQLKNIKTIYPKIMDSITGLYGAKVTQDIVDAERRVDDKKVEYNLGSKEKINMRLERELRGLRGQQDALYDRDIVNNRLAKHRIALLESRAKEGDGLRQEIDNKTKIVYINNQAFNEKAMTVSKLQTTLLFLSLIAFISYGWFMHILSQKGFGWLLMLSVFCYIVTMVRKYYWRDLWKAEYDMLDYLAPNYMAKMCPEQK